MTLTLTNLFKSTYVIFLHAVLGLNLSHNFKETNFITNIVVKPKVNYSSS